VLENVTNVPVEVVLQMGQVVLWLQTLGVVTLILVISVIISIISTFKRKKREQQIQQKLDSIERKLNLILAKK